MNRWTFQGLIGSLQSVKYSIKTQAQYFSRIKIEFSSRFFSLNFSRIKNVLIVFATFSYFIDFFPNKNKRDLFLQFV